MIVTSATHAYLPLWEVYPEIIDLQIRVGIEEYKRQFGEEPIGFWLPECGFTLGIDQILARNRIKYFFLEAHGINFGHPRPKYDVYAPIHCPSGVAAFGRNWLCHNLIWCKDNGFPGDPCYLDFYRDIGKEIEHKYIPTFENFNYPINTGIKYFRNDGGIYNPEMAFSKCDEQANHFIYKCQQWVEHFYDAFKKKPVLVAIIDTEHFGHWWHEGPLWLDLVTRKFAFDQKIVKLISARDYLTMFPTNQVLTPSVSSWGYQGYHEKWLMGSNHWIYQRGYEAIERLKELIMMNLTCKRKFEAFIDQYIRELLLLQASDWAYLINSENFAEFAENTVKKHIHNMTCIYQQVSKKNPLDSKGLNSIQTTNNIFSGMPLLKIFEDIKKV
jgi:1,4-alpha-glucan branching enzyme